MKRTKAEQISACNPHSDVEGGHYRTRVVTNIKLGAVETAMDHVRFERTIYPL